MTRHGLRLRSRLQLGGYLGIVLLQIGCGSPDASETDRSQLSPPAVALESARDDSATTPYETKAVASGVTVAPRVRQLDTASPTGGQGRKPAAKNVLFIVLDDLRPELGCYGKPYMHTPNIDRLAASGLTFNRAYCQQAVCNASRTSFMLGMRPDTTQVVLNQQHFQDTVGDDVVPLGEHFRNHRYESVALGKIFHGPHQHTRSWDVIHYVPPTDYRAGDARYYSPPPGPLPRKKYRPAPVRDTAEAGSGEGGTQGDSRCLPPYECHEAPDSDYVDGWLTDDTIEQLRRLKNRPFFLAVGFRKPHLPFVAPKKYWDLYDAREIQPSPVTDWPRESPKQAHCQWNRLRKFHGVPREGNLSRDETIKLIHGYRACVSFVDACVGRILDELDRLGLADQTIVVLVGDHGFKLSEFSAWCKHTNYELDTRVPLIIRAPGMMAAGEKTDALVELVDIYPTLCEFTGLPQLKQIEGTSLGPLLEQPDRPWKQAAFSQFPRTGCRGYAMRTPRYRLVRWMGEDLPVRKASTVELYDLEHDLLEKVNLAADPRYAELLEQLEAQCEAGWKAVRPPEATGNHQRNLTPNLSNRE